MIVLGAAWSLPTDPELWIVLAYVAGVLIAARAVEWTAKAHFARAEAANHAGFEYLPGVDRFHCLGGATLTLDERHEVERLAIYRAPASHCGGCHLKERCTPTRDSRELHRSLAAWAETDVGRFHQYVSLVMFAVGGVLSIAALLRFRGQPGIGYLALAHAGSLACVALQSRRLHRTHGGGGRMKEKG